MDVQTRPPRRFGTAGAGCNLFEEVWKNEKHVFAANGMTQVVEGVTRKFGTRMEKNQMMEGVTRMLGHPERTPSNTLNTYPVKVLAIDDTTTGPRPIDRFWVRWLEKCQPENLPNYIYIVAPAQELVDENGLQSKAWRWRYQRWGYEAHFWFLRSHEHGGVVRQDRCVLALRRKDSAVKGIKEPKIIETGGFPRSGWNMLTPYGVP